MTNTTWNPNDKNSITLSGSNLTATASSTGDHGVRGTDIKYSGKYYFEVTIGAISGADTGFGVAGPGALLNAITDYRPNNAIGSSAQLAACMFKSGSVFVNGSSLGSVAALVASSVYACAVNLDVSPAKIAFRKVTGGGNWNNNVANDPATGAFDISSTSQLGVFPVFSSGGNTDALTANFGDSGFSGSVPAGYTSGWPVTSGVLYIDPVSLTGSRGEEVGATSKAITMTTQGAGDVIVVVGTENGTTANTVSSVSGSTLGSFTLRKRHHTKPGTIDMVVEEWYCHSSGALAGESITVTLGGTNDRMSIVGFCVVNAATGIWDANAAVPATGQNSGSTSRSVTGISTTNAKSLVLAYGMSPASPDTFASGFASGYSGIGGFYGHTSGTNWCDLTLWGAYVTAAQSSVTAATATITSEQWAAVADAIDEVASGSTGTWASTEAQDTFAGVGRTGVIGTLFASDVKDTFAGAGYPQMKGSWASTEVKDTFAGSGTIPPFGTLAATETKDAMGFTGDVGRPLSVDAHATASAHDTTSAAVTITTTTANDVIVLGILTGGFFHHGTVTSVTDSAGLTWKKRHHRSQFGTNPNMDIWWAKKTSAGSTTITVHTATTGFICIDALAIAGARVDAPFDTHSGAGYYNDTFGDGNPTGTIRTNSAKCMGLAFYSSRDVPTNGTVNAGWTYLDAVTVNETSGQPGHLESAYQVFDTQQFGATTVTFGQSGGDVNDRTIMQDVIVANTDTRPNAATADVIRWFFDGHGNQTVLVMSGTNNSATQTLTTYNPDTVVLVAALVSSSRGARVLNVADDGNHSGWTRRSLVTNEAGNLSLETWWVQMADAFAGNVTVTLDSNVQPGDVLGFIVLGINGPDLFQRGEIFDGHSSLPHTSASSAPSYQTDGPFSTLNENVLEISIVANTSTDPTGFQQSTWLQFLGNFFSSVSGELVSSTPPFNIALQGKFSGPVVINDTAELDVSPKPDQWLMIADALPVGPVSPPQGVWASIEARDIFTHIGDFTSIGIASPGGWVGFPPNHAALAATDTKDRATNSGAFTAIWNSSGWIGYVPLRFGMGLIEAKDVMSLHAWVLGPTTILARWESTEAADRFEFAGLHSQYTTADSTGNRTSLITVTTTASVGGGNPERLVDGLKANGAGSALFLNSAQSGPMAFVFDFGVARVVTEAKWYQNGTSPQPGQWIWRGSSDNATWTTLSAAPFTLDAGNTGAVIGDISSNLTAYRYYQLLQTTNAGGNDTPWLWEIEFKVEGITGTLASTELKDRLSGYGIVIPTAVPIPARKRNLLIVT